MSKKDLFDEEIDDLIEAWDEEGIARDALKMAEAETAERERVLLTKFCAEGGVVLTMGKDEDDPQVNVVFETVGAGGSLETVDWKSYAETSPIGSEICDNLLKNENTLEVLTRLRQLEVLPAECTLVCFRDSYYEFDEGKWEVIYE